MSTPVLNEPPRYTPLAGEVQPKCKEAAVVALAAALTWSPGQSSASAAGRVEAVGGEGGIAKALRPLLQGHTASNFRVIYPQYGGLSDTVRNASVMVLAEQTYLAARERTPRRRELIVDVRLARSGNTWHATRALVPKLPPERHPLSKAAAKLLDNRKVILASPARADVAGGLIDESILQLLLSLSGKWRLNVQVLRSGHPANVFPTIRKSNHTRGRAVDIWAIDGIPVIDKKRCDWRAVMREAARLGATEIGGPEVPTDRKLPSPFFTNLVHQDHVHLGFKVSRSATAPANTQGRGYSPRNP